MINCFAIRRSRSATVVAKMVSPVKRRYGGLRIHMDTITTTLKRQWFAEIVDRKKRIEYREIKPYWTLRLKRVKTPLQLVLRNGMTPPISMLTVRIDRVLKGGAIMSCTLGEY